MATVTLIRGTDTSPWTVPAGVTEVTAECWGAGGAGGGNSTAADGGGGGGGGAYSKRTFTVTPSSTVAWSIGAGGAAVASSTGNAGGNTWFSSNDSSGCVAVGGSGGANPIGGAAGVGGNGGAAASGHGTVKWSGGRGSNSNDASNGRGGYGGSSAGTGADGWSGPTTYSVSIYPTASTPAGAGHGGDGGNTNTAAGSAPVAGQYGGGGGGSAENTAGGAGADGKIVLTYWPPVALNASSTSVTTATGTLTYEEEAVGVSEALTGASFRVEQGQIVGVPQRTYGQQIASGQGTLTYEAESNDVSVGLTGEASTSGRGDVVPSSAKGLTGAETVSEAGEASAGADKVAALTGAQITAQAGGIVYSPFVPRGQQINAAQGTLTPAFGDATTLVGQSITTFAGTITAGAQRNYGQQITVGQGTLSYDVPAQANLDGAETSTESGDVGRTLLVGLRSRKPGRGSIARLLTGLGVSASQGEILGSKGPVLLGFGFGAYTGALGKTRTVALTGTSVQAAQTAIGPAPQAGSSLTTFTLSASSSQTAAPFAFGHAFKQGEIPAGYVPVASATDWQARVLTTWPDGSAKHAIIAGRANVTNGNTALTLSSGSDPGGTALTQTDLASALPPTTIAAGAFSWSLNASVGTGDLHRTVCTGPVMSNFIYRKPVAGSSHLVLWADVRVYKGGNVEIFPWVENAYFLVANPTNDVRTYTVTIGGAQRFSQSIDVKHHTRIPLLTGSTFSYWTGTDPQITPKHDRAYLIGTKLVPNYGWTNPSATTLNGLQQTYTPNTLAGIDSSMGAAGTSAAILNRPDALYVTSGGDARAWRAAMAFALSGGSWSTHYRDESTNDPFKFSAYPSASLQVQDSPLVPEGTGGANGNAVISHQPSYGYLMWLCSGRWWFLDEMLSWAGWNYLQQTVPARLSANGVLRTSAGANTDRGAAWGLRTLAQSLSSLPSSHPCHADYKASWEANMAWYAASNTAANGGIGANALGVQGFYGSFAQSVYSAANSSTHMYGAGWMQNMVHGVLGFTWDLGLPQSAASQANHQTVRDFGYTMPVALAGDGTGGNWNYRQFTVYALNWGTVGGGYYGSWSGAYANFVAGYGALPAGTDLRQHSSGPTLTGADSSNPYFGQALTALVYAVDHGKAGASAGYQRVSGASNFASVCAAIFNDDPVYGVVPRAQVSVPYALPSAGQAVAISSNTSTSIAPTQYMTSGAWNESIFNSYGAGCLVEGYSPAGAYVIAGSGGHNHSETLGAAIFDFQTGVWVRKDPSNSITHAYRTSPGWPLALTDGGPWYEITGSNGMPAPPHPYQHIAPIPVSASFPKGGIVHVGGAAVANESTGRDVCHAFNLDTGAWTRYSVQNVAPGAAATSVDGSVVYDPARNRYWKTNTSNHVYNRVGYFDPATGQYGQTATFSTQPTPSNAAAGTSLHLYQGRYLLIASYVVAKWVLFDIENPSLGWTTLTMNDPGNRIGAFASQNRYAFFPSANAFYGIPPTGGNTLNRVRPPASGDPRTSAWTVDTVTIGGALLPGKYGVNSHYNLLVYVPSLDRLAWLPGGDQAVYLIHPGA